MGTKRKQTTRRHNPRNSRGEWVIDADWVPGVNADADEYWGDPELQRIERELAHDARFLLLRDLVESGEASPMELSEYYNDERPRRSVQRAIEILEHQAARRQGNPRRKKRKTTAKNPGAKATAAKKIYEKFNGRPARKNTTVRAPNGTPANVAKLGALRLIKTADGRKWAFNGAKAPDLAADHRGRLHVVGGSYRANPAGTDHGEIVQIEYETKKPHLGQPKQTIYYHKLGEEGGRRPKLRIDREGLIRIIGGDYRIEADGIHD